MRYKDHHVDFCVVGGGMAGVCAAIAAARHGIKVALIQDRPVLGGNASSEIRMHICGALGKDKRETGIIEEIILENFYRNTNHNYYIWDSVLYEKVRFESNITLLLNCTAQKAEMDGNRIKSVTGWSLTSETYHTVYADIFADCSGDSILAPLTRAEYRVGREGKNEYGERIPSDIADNKTMGMSCLFQIRETDCKQEFIPPEWAYKYDSDDAFAHKGHTLGTNWWWIELGGEDDSIHDTEEIRDELLKIAFGVWDHMKNRGEHGCDNWIMDWIGFLPGKRESRRYKGLITVTQNDVETEGRFPDVIAYGGWTMDDHFPQGFYYTKGHPTIYHYAPSPWGIPYRALISANIENLCFAGRNISVTHSALSSSRVMGTCAILGQALGTAAAIAVTSRVEMCAVDINQLRQTLMEDDCYIPFTRRVLSTLSEEAETDYPVLKNGYDRPIGDENNEAFVELGERVTYRLKGMRSISSVRLVFDSDLNRPEKNMPCYYPLNLKGYTTPSTLVKSYRLVFNTPYGEKTIVRENNHQRLNRIPIGFIADSVTLIPESTYGAEKAGIFAFDIF